jgi:hypothetical protein
VVEDGGNQGKPTHIHQRDVVIPRIDSARHGGIRHVEVSLVQRGEHVVQVEPEAYRVAPPQPISVDGLRNIGIVKPFIVRGVEGEDVEGMARVELAAEAMKSAACTAGGLIVTDRDPHGDLR